MVRVEIVSGMFASRRAAQSAAQRDLAVALQLKLRPSRNLTTWIERALSEQPQRHLAGITADGQMTASFGSWRPETQSLLLCSVEVKDSRTDRTSLVLAVAELTEAGKPSQTATTWIVVDEERRMIRLFVEQKPVLDTAPAEVLYNLRPEEEEMITAANTIITDSIATAQVRNETDKFSDGRFYSDRIPLTEEFRFIRF